MKKWAGALLVTKSGEVILQKRDINPRILNSGKITLFGGGLEGEEDINAALRRECLEEIGCDIETFGELGEIVEYRDKFSLKQHSYCFIANLVGAKNNPDFTQGEIENDFSIKWLPLENALELLLNDRPEEYEGKFIQIRDSLFLKEAIKFLQNSAIK